ncbi:MAG: type IV toxin-antitoxin system AbiEi family antitoxin [Endomicrobia bacterium]|nr:type IV toxin-antitoxin system AbiEi family antitoxin [Endomicrobiia bacterium]
MNVKTQTFLKKLDPIPPNTVVLSSWLLKQGISSSLQQKYRLNGWLKPIGKGAFLKFSSEKASFSGAVYALQKQAELKVHIGAMAALVLYGKTHYGRFKNNWQLFANRGVVLPKWFKEYDFGDKDSWKLFNTDFLPEDLALQEYDTGNFTVRISKVERAAIEALYLAPKDVGLQEMYEIFGQFRNFRPTVLQTLLEQCKSVKVKRLFLYFAEKTNASWLKFDLSKIDLGKGVRVIQKGGKYNAKYSIMIGDLDDNQ